MIKVAYILTPITFGGSEKVSLNFLQAVNKERYRIYPVLLARPWEEETYFASELRKVGYTYESIPVAVERRIDPLRVPRVFGKVLSILKKFPFDLVHTHGYFADICALPVAKLIGMKRIATCHGFIDLNRKLNLYNSLDKTVLRLSDKVICVSESIKQILVAGGLREINLTVIPNAVSANHECSRENMRVSVRSAAGIGGDDPVVGYAGRLSEEKGLNTLFDAFQKVTLRKPKARLWVAGDGPLRSTLERLAGELEISNNVRFLGFQENIFQWMAALDVFVLPSLTEGMPMALLESMSMGTPAVASAVGDIPRVIDAGVNGLLVSPGAVGQLTQAILNVLDDKELAHQLSTNAIKTVQEKHSIVHWVRKIEDVYRDVLATRGYR